MKLNKTILDTVLKQLLSLDNDDLEFNKSNLSLVANKSIKDNIWLSDNTVDLDLPSGTLWMKYNIGATCGNTKESWYGNYYAWGELEPKTEYTKENYTYKDNPKILPLENDAAYQYNKLLRIPTKEQIEELVNYTSNEWVENYNRIDGLNGRIFTSKSNGDSLFIPAVGYYGGNHLYCAGTVWCLGSSSLCDVNDYYAYSISSLPDHDILDGINDRCSGFSVRGVSI